MVQALKQLVQYFGGESDELPALLRLPIKETSAAILRGLWWGMLLILIFVFCGQSSKFIYIDF